MVGNDVYSNYGEGVAAVPNIFISNFLLIGARDSYKDIYRRSYNLNVDYNTINSLENIFDRHGVVNDNNTMDEVAIANEIPNIMTVNSNVNSVAKIANGWGERRFRFIMTVESNVGNTTTVSYIQGYSEYYDISLSGMIDPNMKFYINSITNVSRMVDIVTGQVIVRPLNTFNLISDTAGTRWEETIDGNGEDLKLSRPLDIVTAIKNGEMYGDATINNISDNYSNGIAVSDRANNSPVKFFTKTVNSFINAKSLSDISYDTNDVMKTASNKLAETNILTTPFISALYNVTGVPSSNSFTAGILELINPDVGSRTQVFLDGELTKTSDIGILNTDQTEDLYKQNIETVIATTIAQSITSMMIENLVAEMTVECTNVTGLPTVVITNFNSYIEGINVIGYINKIKARIESILMPEITQGGLLMIEFSLWSDILGDTTVSLSVNNTPPVVYRFPTFADSLYSPVISDAASRNILSNDFSSVMDLTYAHMN